MILKCPFTGPHTQVENIAKRIVVGFPLRFFWPPWSAVIKQLQFGFFGSSGCKHGKVDNSWSLLKFSEGDPKLYANFEFYKIEFPKHLENIWIYKAKPFMFTKNNFKQRICILEDGASGEQVGDIEKIIVKNLFKIESHYIKLMNIWIFFYDDLKFRMNSRNMKKIQLQNI